MDIQDIVYRLRTRAEIRRKIGRGDGEVDRISRDLLEAADEIEALRKLVEEWKDRVVEAAEYAEHYRGCD